MIGQDHFIYLLINSTGTLISNILWLLCSLLSIVPYWSYWTVNLSASASCYGFLRLKFILPRAWHVHWIAICLAIPLNQMTEAWQIWILLSFLWRSAGIHHARIRIGCNKLKSHFYNNLHVIEEESCQCGYRNEDPFHFFFECPRYVALRNNLFMSVAQHTDCSLQTLLFGDPKLNHKQNCDIFDAVQHFITLSKRFDWSPYAVSYCTLPLHLRPPPLTFPGHTASKQSPWQERFV